MRPKGSYKRLDLRFNTKYIIDENTDCWQWQGGKNNLGYGMIREFDKMRTAHRVSYELHHGNIPEDKIVCHTCDNRGCVNPAHLWLGTHQDNTDDMMRKGRHKNNSYIYGARPKHDCPHCNLTVSHNVFGRHVKACQKRYTK